MTIKQHGGIFGRNPTFNVATASEFVGPVSGLSTSAAALKSSATTGLMQITGPAASQTRTMTIPDANFAVARTDAAQAFTGDQTLTDGNLIVSNGKGIDFSATAGTGTSELFDDYEEGSFSPVLSDALSGGNTVVADFGIYVKIGRVVIVTFKFGNINTSGMTAGNTLYLQGLPFTTLNTPGIGVYVGSTSISDITSNGSPSINAIDNQTYAYFTDDAGVILVSAVSSGSGDIYGTLTYQSA